MRVSIQSQILAVERAIERFKATPPKGPSWSVYEMELGQLAASLSTLRWVEEHAALIRRAVVETAP